MSRSGISSHELLVRCTLSQNERPVDRNLSNSFTITLYKFFHENGDGTSTGYSYYLTTMIFRQYVMFRSEDVRD